MPFAWLPEKNQPTAEPGSVVISSFPSAGLAATVAAHYMVQSLKLPRTGIFASEEIPPVAIIQGGEVNPVVRVYGRPGLSVVVSEFPPTPEAARGLASTILDGAEARKARAVVALEGVIPHPTGPGDEELGEAGVWAITSRPDPKLREQLLKAGARPLDNGVLAGVSGALLVEGMTRQIPVAVLLVSARANEGFPDHRAGASLIETLVHFLPELAIDTTPLRGEAEIIEKAIRASMQSRSKSTLPRTDDKEPTIYQ
jgi:predicted ATP-grasp superfamily ATP-dependent carboligase